MPHQEVQRFFVELAHIFINGRMATVFEDQQFGVINTVFQRLCKASGSREIVAAKGYQGWSLDSVQSSADVVCENRIRLLDKAVHTLRRPASYEISQ